MFFEKIISKKEPSIYEPRTDMSQKKKPSYTNPVESNRQISRRMDTHGIIVVERFATFHYY